MTHKTWYGFRKFACIYPGLKLWMQRNNWNACRLAQEAGLYQSTIIDNLNGTTEMKMHTIRRILKATGLTFEQAFGEELTPEKAREDR